MVSSRASYEIMKPKFFAALSALTVLLGSTHPADAQWQTQSFLVKPGWTAVYLNVDATYQSLDQLVGSDPFNPIAEIWLWKAPASTIQYITTPSNPLTGSRDWAQWSRPGVGAASTLSALIPNAAYLVHSSATTNYTWKIKGKPIAPSYTWTTTGLNFIGFPTPINNAPPFDTFLGFSPAFAGAAEIYQYIGGDLRAINPSQVIPLVLHATHVTRGQAYWIRAGSVFNDYFGPFQVSLGGSGEVALGAAGGQYSIYLHNITASNLVVCANLLPSETPPAGQSPIAGTPPPVLVRGNLNPTNLTYAYTDLSTGGAACWTLKPKGQPGSDITVVLGVNRSALGNVPGALSAGILRFTDSFNLSQVDVPISAQASSATGLWVGKTSVTQVGNYLKTYQRDLDNNPVVSSNGNYIVTGINTNLGAVAQSFPLRLILHNDGTNVVLLQRVFYGLSAGSNLVVATQESALDPQHRDTARRISAADLPWSSANQPWPFSGQFGPGGALAVTIQLSYDDQASNPFLHTYHPDHDNLDATFQTKLPRGSESYDVTRQITLNISPPGNDFASLTAVGQSLYGTYLETITVAGLGSSTRDFNVSGIFTLNRISPIPVLTRL
jgi:hypothetical protein